MSGLLLLPLALLGLGEGDFWGRTLTRGAEFERWMLEGDQRMRMNQRAQLEQAEIAYAEAVKLAPRDPRARREHALSLERLGRFADCVVELRAARALDQHLDPAPVAMELGICLAHLGEHAQAAQEYRRALDARDGITLGIAHWNLGDVEMALGRLEASIRQYRLALAAAQSPPTGGQLLHDLPVMELALAVAYDRAEDAARAREAAKRALAGNVLGILREPSGIFFVPPEDQHYSLALAEETSGNRPAALEAWDAYLRATPRGPWSARARQHLERLRAEAPAARPAGGSP